MPATPFPPHVPPDELALSEIDVLGDEAVHVLARAGEVLDAFKRSRESVRESDVALLREARRDLQHARILLEGICRTHGIAMEVTR